MMEDWYMKTPCKHCPYRHDVKPFLTAERGQELAYHAENPYNSFPCHKTIEHDEEGDGVCDSETKECAGFMTMQHALNDNTLPEGFKPAYDVCYSCTWEMIDAYSN